MGQAPAGQAPLMEALYAGRKWTRHASECRFRRERSKREVWR